jgi:hypothetical protein
MALVRVRQVLEAFRNTLVLKRSNLGGKPSNQILLLGFIPQRPWVLHNAFRERNPIVELRDLDLTRRGFNLWRSLARAVSRNVLGEAGENSTAKAKLDYRRPFPSLKRVELLPVKRRNKVERL